MSEWVPKHLGEQAGHWIIPQAPIHVLIRATDQRSVEENWADFLFVLPNENPFIVELDGPHHQDHRDSDHRRDEALAKMGIGTIRIPVDEVDREYPVDNSLKCSQVVRRFRDFNRKVKDELTNADVADFILDCSFGSKIQFAIARAIEYGWLSGDRWSIAIDGGGSTACAAVEDALNMLAAYDTLLVSDTAPDMCTVEVDDCKPVLIRKVDGRYEQSFGTNINHPDLHLAVDWRSSPFHEIDDAFDGSDIIIRGGLLPVELRSDRATENSRYPIECSDFDEAARALTVFLQQGFRKTGFRDGQGKAVFDTLRLQDRIVLLATGAGKSMVYQLAGLLMPGVTLVVDPIVALIDDQVASLKRYGIDRAVGVSSELQGERRRRVQEQITNLEHFYVLVTPERLQIREFKVVLDNLSGNSLINLVVVDEAHCVSEWGHDFRPAYLGLRRMVEDFCTDINRCHPPLLALTATASRPVLNDVKTELEIDGPIGEAAIRPSSFNRPELVFSVERARNTTHAEAKLERVLKETSDVLGGQERGQRALGGFSGIVFSRTSSNLRELKTLTRNSVSGEVGIYSGAPPRGKQDGKEWDAEKKTTAARFRNNEICHLVATNAYGIGIDKPDIRYVIHFGMPSSLEGYYQEAGRAGRDGMRSVCTVIFRETDEHRNRQLLDPTLDFSEFKNRYSKLKPKKYSERDDITTACWFHDGRFRGVEAEWRHIKSVVDALRPLEADEVNLPFKIDGAVEKELEYALVRLRFLGVVDDYEKQYRDNEFKVRKSEYDYDESKSLLIAYVARSQPTEAESLRLQIEADEFHWSTNAVTRLTELARILIEFIYRTREAASREKIREAMQLARDARSGDDLRDRMLSYFEEGEVSHRIDELLDAPQVGIEDWLELFEDFLPATANAMTLRGQSARELESAPLHPGLLLARGVSEVMCPNPDSTDSWQRIAAGIDNLERLAPGTERGESFTRLFDLSDRGGDENELGPVLTHALLESAERGSKFHWCHQVVMSCARDLKVNRGTVMATVGVFETRRLTREIGKAIGSAHTLAQDDEIREYLGLKEMSK